MITMPETSMNAHIAVDTSARSVRSKRKNMDGSRKPQSPMLTADMRLMKFVVRVGSGIFSM